MAANAILLSNDGNRNAADWTQLLRQYADELGVCAASRNAVARDRVVCDAFIEACEGEFHELARAIATSATRR